MYSLILTDVDGTLIKNDLTLSKNTINALQKARDKGIRICISSGRYLQAISFFKEELGIKDLILSGINGGLIKDGNRVLRDVEFPDDVYTITANFLNKKAKSFIAFGESTYAIDSNDSFYLMQDKICHQKGVRMSLLDRKEVETKIGQKVHKLLIKDTEREKILELKEELTKLLFGKAQVVSSSFLNLEVLPLNVNKVDTVFTLEEKLGIKRDEMIAFGDWDNDIAMLKAVGMGIAMENANDETKKSAKLITKSNEEDGISYALETLLNIV